MSFSQPELLSTEFGSTLLDAYCPSVFYGDWVGYATSGCFIQMHVTPPIEAMDESKGDAIARQAALSYLRKHLDRLPVVVAARLGRLLYVYRPLQQVHFNVCGEAFACPGGMNWPVPVAWAEMVAFLSTLPLAWAGGVMLRRARHHVAPYVAVAVLSLLVVASLGAWTRYVAYLYSTMTLAAAPPLAELARRVTLRSGLNRDARVG